MNSIAPFKDFENRPCQIDQIKYYKPQFFGHKWKDCYAFLWPTSHFKWFSKKSNKSHGLINIEKSVPYIYTGVQTCKLPAKQPTLPPGYFTRNLVAILLDKEAKHVLWFLFDTIVDLTLWVSAIKRTIPRLNPSFYNLELGCVTGYSYTLSRSNSEKKRILKRNYSNASDCYHLTTTITNYGYSDLRSYHNNPPCYSNTNAEIIFIGGDGYNGVESETAGFCSVADYTDSSNENGGGYGGGDSGCSGSGGDCGGGSGGDCGGGW